MLHHGAHDRRLLQLQAAVVCIGLMFMQILSTFGLELAARGYRPATYGLLVSLNGALIVLGEVPRAVWTRRFAPRQMMALAFALIGVGFGIIGLATSLVGLVAGMVVLTFGEMINMPVSAADISDLAPEHLRGSYMGLFGFSRAISLGTGPFLGASLFAYSRAWLWGAGALLG